MTKHNQNKNVDERAVADLRIAVLGVCLLGLVLFAITLFIDLQARAGRIYLPSWVSIGSVFDARVLLTSILGAVSTVLGLVFSVVLLVLSMAATQFGPRLLRRFILDQNGEITIGLFCTTFLFDLLTLVLVRSNEGGQDFIPHLTTLTNVVLVIVSFASLICYSQNVRRAIQAGNLMASVDSDLHNAITTFIQIGHDRAQESMDIRLNTEESVDKLRERCQTQGYSVITRCAGYLQNVDQKALVKAAISINAVISLETHPGQFVLEHTALATVIPYSQGPIIEQIIVESLQIGPNRTLIQDPEFAITQIVEIASRALSKGINDPFTAVACVDWLSNNIISLTHMSANDGAWHDKMGHIRLMEHTPKFPRLVAAAFDMIRQYGESSPSLLIRMLQNFARIGIHLKEEEQRAAIMRQANAILEQSKRQMFASVDQDDLMRCYEKVCTVLAPENL